MHSLSIALFGESQKGEFHRAYYCSSLAQLSDMVGEPPSEEARGLHLAIQSILYQYPVIFFRVQEEGFSSSDYFRGLQLLEQKEKLPKIAAVCLPGVGNAEIIGATDPICLLHNSFLILTEKDLYDYLTS